MKKVALFSCVVVVIVVLTDIFVGIVSRYYLNRCRLPGDYEEVDYLIKDLNEDILVLGSSIALNGLNPSLLTDSLGISCYNGGANGQCLPFYESLLECVEKHTRKPTMLLLGMQPNELSGTGIGGRYNLLMPYYHIGFENIDKRLESKSRIEPYLLRSNLYRYNTIWWRIFLYHFITPGVKGIHGFTGKPVPFVFPTLIKDSSTELSDERLQSFHHIFQICQQNDIQLVVFFPPIYKEFEGKTATIDYMEKFCEENGIPCFNDSQDRYFLQHKELFYDNVHVNINGCNEYTLQMVERLKSIL